jgi:hypothetical protein
MVNEKRIERRMKDERGKAVLEAGQHCATTLVYSSRMFRKRGSFYSVAFFTASFSTQQTT